MTAKKSGGKGGGPLVAASGQAWKVTAGIGGMLLAAVGSVAWFFAPDEARSAVIALAIVTGGIGIAAVLAVRCPRCGRSLGAWSFQTGSLTTWHEELVAVAECPQCGLRAGDAAPTGRR